MLLEFVCSFTIFSSYSEHSNLTLIEKYHNSNNKTIYTIQYSFTGMCFQTMDFNLNYIKVFSSFWFAKDEIIYFVIHNIKTQTNVAFSKKRKALFL